MRFREVLIKFSEVLLRYLLFSCLLSLVQNRFALKNRDGNWGERIETNWWDDKKKVLGHFFLHTRAILQIFIQLRLVLEADIVKKGFRLKLHFWLFWQLLQLVLEYFIWPRRQIWPGEKREVAKMNQLGQKKYKISFGKVIFLG